MEKIEIETFRKPSQYTIDGLTAKMPSCFNGQVSVRKYRVTVELIDEPVEVIRGRIKKLWNECRNFHHWLPLQNEAKKYGMELRHKY